MMKKLLFLTCILSHAFAADVIKIGTEGSYKPFNYLNDQGQLTGFDVELGKALCAQAKLTCEFQALPFDGLIPALQAKKIDVIDASMTINEERAKVIAFSKPFYQTPGRFIAPKKTTIKVGTDGKIDFSSLKSKAIAVQTATIFESYLKDMHAGNLDLKTYPSYDSSLLDLSSGRVEAIFGDGVFLEDFLSSPQGADFAFIGENFTDPKYFGQGIGFGFRTTDKNLQNQFNQAYDAIVADGTFAKIARSYFQTDLQPKK